MKKNKGLYGHRNRYRRKACIDLHSFCVLFLIFQFSQTVQYMDITELEKSQKKEGENMYNLFKYK
jgi:hypothetical protein